MNRRQSLGGGARGFIPFKGKNVGVETPTYKGITSEVGWAFSPTKSKMAFTLAEVLITLGIIGVVAALTLPTLIQNHANKVVETRLMKFYSAINQAITLAEVDYGDRTYWYAKYDDLEKDAQGRPVTGKSDREKWVNKYLAPYMKITETKYTSNNFPIFYLADGGVFMYTHGTSLNDWMFYTKDFFKCTENKGIEYNMGVCTFPFSYNPTANWDYIGRSFEPYKWSWDGTREGLINGITNGQYRACNTSNQIFCAAYIQYNGWKIPDDYPVKVRY